MKPDRDSEMVSMPRWVFNMLTKAKDSERYEFTPKEKAKLALLTFGKSGTVTKTSCSCDDSCRRKHCPRKEPCCESDKE